MTSRCSLRPFAGAVLMSVLMAVSGSGRALAASPPCGRAGQTLAQAAGSRVFERGRSTFACTTGHPARRLGLSYYGGSSSGEGGIEPGAVALNGHDVASSDFRADSMGFQLARFHVVVRDLLTGHVLLDESHGVFGQELVSMERLVLGRRGRLAYIWSRQRATTGDPPTGIVGQRISRSPSCGSPVVADDPTIDPRSLTLRDGQLEWRAAAGPQHVAFCPGEPG